VSNYDFGAYMRATYNNREHADERKVAYLKLYHGIILQVPNFKKTIEEFEDDFESIMDLINLVRSYYALL
jgi:hypothetical protein